ncbi:MAG TPA: replicative DNA helicase, partial [Nitrolancea sp.]|nr:replicative DNA helicase [Nitrolancea sp.]
MIDAVEKLPPSNLEAEQSVLGSLLIDRDAVIRVASFLKPEDFYSGGNGAVYQAVLDLYNRRVPPDFVTVVDELERRERLQDIGGVSYLTGLIETVPTAVHIEYYARIVERTATLRRLIDAGAEIIGIGYDEGVEVEDALDKAERAIFNVSQKRTLRDFIPIGEVLEHYFDKLDTIQQHRGEVVGVPTGYADLDKLTGGLQRSDLIILAARPSVGKTSLQLGMAHSAAVKHGKSVGIFSLEMSAEQLVQRLLAMETGVDSHRLRLGFIDDTEWDHISRAFGRLAEANIFIDDTPGISVMELRSKARRLLAERGLDLVIVDYLQLAAGRRSENRVQEISEISRGLKGLARELNVPVLALSQLSRAVESRADHRPMLSDLRESGCLAGETVILDPLTGRPRRIDQMVGDVGAQVWGIDEHFKLGVHPVSRAFCTGIKPLYEVRLASGRRIQATANHPFRTIHGWQALEELPPASVVATARHVPEPDVPTAMSEPELVLLAHLIGDGCIAPRQPIHYTSADPANIEAVRGAAEAAFGIKPRVVRQENWWHVYLPSPTRLTRGKPHPITRW